MRCPFCHEVEDKVIDSRASNDQSVIRRRRECTGCRRRFTTYERIEESPFRVVKRDGSRVAFDRSKIVAGILRACEKRPVTVEQIDQMARDVETRVGEMFDSEVPSRFIGDMVMDELRKVDQVAYVRFASVYRQFQDVEEFFDELRGMFGKKGRDGQDQASPES